MNTSPTIHLVNPSRNTFGVAVITPRWLFVLAAATGTEWGDPRITDESLTRFDLDQVKAGDVVGIGIHTGNVKRGYELGNELRARGAWVVYGGIHATLFPDEVLERGGAHAVVKGDGDLIWRSVVKACLDGKPERIYEGGRVSGESFVPARWDLMPPDNYMLASVQTLRGCPKHCSFCSVWRTDGQEPRNREVEKVIGELVDLRRRGFRFIALADDNFYPVPLSDLKMADRRQDKTRLNELLALRQERFDLMKAMEALPSDMNFFTQITMEAAEDEEFLQAMNRARIRGALVGIEAVTPEGLKDIYKGFNLAGDALVDRLKQFRKHGVHILGSFIFGLPSDRSVTFDATLSVATRADIALAQFVLLQPFPGTVDFEKWQKEQAEAGNVASVDGVPITQHWLMDESKRPKIYIEHPTMTGDEIRMKTQGVWDRFYSWGRVWSRSDMLKSYKSRIGFVLISKLYRQMYANTGLATDSARTQRSAKRAQFLGRLARRFFVSEPMPDLQVPLQSRGE
jgi:radical SAM superfamily enzyme YgiQ (UPF0313 family)